LFDLLHPRSFGQEHTSRYHRSVADSKITGVTYKLGQHFSHPDWDCMQVIPERDGRPAESFLIGRAPDGTFHVLTDALVDRWERLTEEKDVNSCRKLFEDRDKTAAEQRVKIAGQSS
jgi:hypothetical protein